MNPWTNSFLIIESAFQSKVNINNKNPGTMILVEVQDEEEEISIQKKEAKIKTFSEEGHNQEIFYIRKIKRIVEYVVTKIIL